MITIDSQVHGYRQGHQLLSSSTNLSKVDQSVVDRLSDVAGPLRPGEIFAPYLSAYPLPSGTHYVFARTWQDDTVPRAGCVRTLSLIIPIASWSVAKGLAPFIDILSPENFPCSANQIVISQPKPEPLPPTVNFRASELLEALFLEESKPVAIFDAPNPELIAIRILSALWPSIRRRFALSTFALSPRRIEGRDFDLVFAPKDARPKFVDWSGRRIDGQANQDARHRWTGAIVDRVFNDPLPRLLDARKLELVSTDDASTTTALRIALLWDELHAKLKHSPSAVLGLLDIANSRTSFDAEAIVALKPVLADAARRATTTLPAAEAWEFIGAMIKKMHGTPMATEIQSVAVAAGLLAEKSPIEGVSLLDQPDPLGAIEILAPAIANGISTHFDHSVELALANARPETLAKLIVAGRKLAEKIVAKPALINRLGEILPILSQKQFDAIRIAALPLLVADFQLIAAQPLFASLDADDLLQEVRHLAGTTKFEATSFIPPLVVRARDIDEIDRLRNTLISLPSSDGRENFLWATLAPCAEDVIWLLREERLDIETTERFLLSLLRTIDSEHFCTLFSTTPVVEAILSKLPIDATDILHRAVLEQRVPLTIYVTIVMKLLPVTEGQQQVELAKLALERCLIDHFQGNEITTISSLLGIVGRALDGVWVVRRGLAGRLNSSVINRNLLAFIQATEPAYARIIEAVDDLAFTLAERQIIDLDDHGAEACAHILLDANSVNSNALLRVSGRLLPILLRSRDWPISTIVVSTFPFVYRELARANEIPDLFKFIPFVDWDRCKAARQNLVDAFISSQVWAPGDLALTAYLCSDIEKILGQAANSSGGYSYIQRITEDLQRLPDDCREQTTDIISKIRSEW